MTRILTFLAAAFLALGVQAQSADPKASITQTIDQQLEAFQTEDLDTAFAIASPTIQNMFGSAQNFGQMVQNGYPMVWRPRAVDYLDQRREGAAIWQLVQFTDTGGTAHWFAYEMVQISGDWRINGVYPVEAPNPSV